jgi:hypothetical protein
MPTTGALRVRYQGRIYQVLHAHFCGDPRLVTLASRTQDGCPFPSKKAACTRWPDAGGAHTKGDD